MTTLDLPLRAPGGEPVDLWRTLVSHGFAELSPTHLDEEHRTLAFTVRVPGGRPRRVRISEGASRTARLEIQRNTLAQLDRRAMVRDACEGQLHDAKWVKGRTIVTSANPARLRSAPLRPRQPSCRRTRSTV